MARHYKVNFRSKNLQQIFDDTSSSVSTAFEKLKGAIMAFMIEKDELENINRIILCKSFNFYGIDGIFYDAQKEECFLCKGDDYHFKELYECKDFSILSLIFNELKNNKYFVPV